MTLGRRISVLRKEKKFSQEYVAETLNVSRQAVSKWENDLSIPDMENLIMLAKLLEVDVQFLATGQISDDMESDPLPEPPVPAKTVKPIKGQKKHLPLFLVASVLLNLLLFCLWRYESKAERLMEEYCAANAANAAVCFADYVQHKSEGSYWQGVAAFRSFMTGYHLLRNEQSGASYNFQQCNILFYCLIYDRERCIEYMDQIRRIMRLLGENMDSFNTYHELTELNNEIRYGD